MRTWIPPALLIVLLLACFAPWRRVPPRHKWMFELVAHLSGATEDVPPWLIRDLHTEEAHAAIGTAAGRTDNSRRA